MKLHVAGLFGIMVMALSTVGCGVFPTQQAKAPLVGTTTVTSAPMSPDPILPPVIWDDEEEPVTPIAPPLETWGARPPTPEELEKYGF